MKLKRFLLFFSAAVTFCAGSVRAEDGKRLSFSFRSRALADASFSGYGTEDVQGYYRLEDFRLGFKAVFSDFEMKADVGYGGGKVAVKDLLLNWHSGNSTLSAGNGYEPFSMDMLTSTADMMFHQSAASVLAFTGSRKLGVTYHLHLPYMYFAAGAYTNNDVNRLGESQRNSYVLTSRCVWRNVSGNGFLCHAGGAFSYRTKEYNRRDPFTAGLSSAGITSLFGENVLEAEIENAGHEIKGLVEFLLSGRRFMIQGEYFIDCYGHSGTGVHSVFHGGYLQAGYLILGESFGYDAAYAVPARPESDSALELVARVNHTDMNSGRTGVYGGEESDVSLGLNYYINRYVGLKFNLGALFPYGRCNPFYDRTLVMAQFRMQYIF